MAKELYWECPKCGNGYHIYDGEKPYRDGVCKYCGATMVKTPYTFNEVILGNGELTASQVIDDIMENYIKSNPQYDPDVYEMWQKRRDGTESTFNKPDKQDKTHLSALSVVQQQ